jgi:hypothetical protein
MQDKMIAHGPRKHRESVHFQYEIVSRQFPVTSKARKALRLVTRDPLLPEKFLDYIMTHYSEVYQNLEWVRFNETLSERDGKTMRLAIVNLTPNPVCRDYLYNVREEVASQTGWYPIVQGSRAVFAEVPAAPRQSLTALKSRLESNGRLGHLQRLIPLCSSSENGSGFILEGSAGRVLMDFGMKWPSTSPGAFMVRLLTHLHGDHSRGIWDAIDQDDSPIILSRPSMAYLTSLQEVHPDAKRKLIYRAFFAEDAQSIVMADDCRLDLFPVFHCPGSYGVVMTDNGQSSFTYFGDACLKNGFYDFTERAKEIISSQRSTNKWVLLDATMVGRPDYAIEEEDTPEVVLDRFAAKARRRNVVFVAFEPEGLLYPYIRVFALTRSLEPPIRILLSRDLYRVLRTLWQPVIERDPGRIDPYVHSIIGKNKSNFAGSHRLYPLTDQVLSQISSEEACILFCTPKDIDSVIGLAARVKHADVILSKSAMAGPAVPPGLVEAGPRNILRISSPDWSFHSDEKSLAEFVRWLSNNHAKVVLFHNYPDRLKKFISRNGLDRNMVWAVSEGQPIDLANSVSFFL